MSHQEKQEIFDQYAEQQGYGDWDDLKSEIYHETQDAFLFAIKIDSHMFAACDLVQAEQQKRIAEKARTKTNEEHTSIIVDKDSIINPENLIK